MARSLNPVEKAWKYILSIRGVLAKPRRDYAEKVLAQWTLIGRVSTLPSHQAPLSLGTRERYLIEEKLREILGNYSQRENPGEDQYADYGWIITVDKVFDPEIDKHDDKGTAGPRNISPDIYKRLKKGEGLSFKMYDDDGNYYYAGRYIGPEDGEEMFGPLNDFGTPNAGAVRIDYKTAAGKWETI